MVDRPQPLQTGVGAASSRALDHRLRAGGATPDSGCSRPPQMGGDSLRPCGQRLQMHSAHRPPGTSRIRRVTKGGLRGTVVEAGDPPPAETTSAGERQSGWAMSSFELKYGLDVNDADDTVPAELFDKLFGGRGAY